MELEPPRWQIGDGNGGSRKGVVRSVERKAQKDGWLLRQGPLWANSPVVSPVRLEVGRERSGGAREERERRAGGR
ncbi:hypothetical protein GCM10010365_48220 [Streptomyces poonensis]|uniref:Uncharacterized protein n=1 Tax=Streptomyces poonensis TaxID=68255 RepID=A0A918PVV7_9ACTN|nr:hypothetical protein GCM10010365_48220 [Streptomyces poonensis]